MKQTTIKQAKKGQLFRLTKSESAHVWVRGYYIPSERKYEAYKFDNTNHETFIKPERKVYVDFVF